MNPQDTTPPAGDQPVVPSDAPVVDPMGAPTTPAEPVVTPPTGDETSTEAPAPEATDPNQPPTV